MKLYFAPLESVTTHIFRNAHADLFPGCDGYYAPFIVACQESGFKQKELRDLLPENNPGLKLIPQLLSNDAAAFLFAAHQISALGYDEINLNLGCPSGTVVSKHRGSGLLAFPDDLDAMLEGVFSRADVKISVKTRLGLSSPDEFYKILEIYNKYPLAKLIIHPRVRADMYKNTPNLHIFGEALAQSRNPVCYNGDIFTPCDFYTLTDRFPGVESVMIGRGGVANPGLIREIGTGAPITEKDFLQFHSRLYDGYQGEYSGDTNVLHRMKELWYYMSAMFPGSEKQIKRINKCQKCCDYDSAVSALFRECEFDPASGFAGTR